MISEKLFSSEEYKENLDSLIDLLKSREAIDANDAFRLFQLSQLTRVADALEDIASKMEHIGNSVELLEKLADCVDEPLPLAGGSQFCIKKNID